MGLALPSVTGGASAARAYRLSMDHLGFMTTAAKLDCPREACGLIMRKGETAAIYRARNVSSEPEHSYSVDSEILKLAARMIRDGWRIEAIWHSHPNGLMELSAGDKAGAVVGGKPLYPGVVYLVVGLTENPMKEKDFFTSVTAWIWPPDARVPSPLKVTIHAG